MEKTSKQLALSGQLKPAIRLGLALSEFEQALDARRRKEFQQQRAASASASASSSSHQHHPSRTGDVIRATEEINQAGLQKHQLFPPRFATRLGVFFSRIQAFAAVGDALIGGSQNLIASGVWGAVRFCLLGAVDFLSYFEKLSTLFLRLGTSWSLHERFAELFPQSNVLQDYLCEYLILVVGLCRRVVTFTKKNLASKFFATLGSSFEDEFSPIQKEIEQWGYIIQKQAEHLAINLNIKQGQRSLDLLGGLSSHISTEARRIRAEAFSYQVIHHLSPGQSQYEKIWRRHRAKGTCKWVFEHESFKRWRSLTITSANLVLEGKLGSGKTVAMANLVTHMHTTTKMPTAYFFCDFKDPDSLKAINILRSIAYHILDSIKRDDINWESIMRRWNSIFPNLTSPYDVVSFLLRIMPNDQQYSIIIDGLDSCAWDEATDVLDCLRRLMNARLVHLCYSTRSRFRDFQTRLPPQTFLINLDEVAHQEEIELFIQQEISRRNENGDLEAELVSLAIRQLVAGSQGMYLWVSLQLDSIFPRDSATVVTNQRVLDLLMSLPQNLPDAFERALESISDNSYAVRIFKLVMAAETPLTVDELRVALTITPGRPIWDAERVPRDGRQLLSLCGGDLIDIDEEDGRIRVIHHSVIQHLQTPTSNENTQKYHFSHEDSHNHAGCICVTYLNLPLLDSRLAITKKLEGDNVVERIMESVHEDPSRLLRLAKYIKLPKHTSRESYQLDIGRLMLEAQALRARPASSGADVLCFQDYAIGNWLTHTQYFKSDNKELDKCWNLWQRLVNGHIQHISLPFTKPRDGRMAAIAWAIEHNHGALFLFLLGDGGGPFRLNVGLREVIELVSMLDNLETIRNEWLGDIIAQLAQVFQDIKHVNVPYESKLNDLIAIPIRLGADPTLVHHYTGLSPLKIVLQGLLTRGRARANASSTAQVKLVNSWVKKEALNTASYLLEMPQIQWSLNDAWVPLMLVELIEKGEVPLVENLLDYNANCHVEPPYASPLGAAIFHGNDELVRKMLGPTGSDMADPSKSWYRLKPALELALEKRDASIATLLCCTPKVLSGTTSMNLSFLWMAVGRMSDGWPSILLEKVPQSQSASTIFQPGGCLRPLEIAVKANRTRLSINLLNHCADIPASTLAKLSEILTAGQSHILRAKIAEYSQAHPRYDPPDAVLDPSQPPRDTALLVATRLLQANFNKKLTPRDEARYFGSPRYSEEHVREMEDLSWRVEVCFIIRLLVQGATPEYINTRDSAGNTALHYLSHCFLEPKTLMPMRNEVPFHLAHTIDLLFSLGAKSSIANPQGSCPWWIGISSSTSIFKVSSWIQEFDLTGSFKLEHLPVHIQDEEGNTILHHLVSSDFSHDSESSIKNMLSEGADPNIANALGETPLHIAVRRGLSTSRVIEPLLQAGADPNATLPNDSEGNIMDVAITLRNLYDANGGDGWESLKTVRILEHYINSSSRISFGGSGST